MTLNTVNQLLKLAELAAEYNINIICIQEHSYNYRELMIKYHDTRNGWTFVFASSWENSVDAIKGDVGMLPSPCALKSSNSIQPMCASFNGNSCTKIISCCSRTNASNETDIITFYIELPSLV